MKTPVVVLGATGMVGQRAIQLLENHPSLEVVAVAASERSAGLPYNKATNWRLPGQIPAYVSNMTVLLANPANMPKNVKVAISALDRVPALPIEGAFREAGFAVVSNASAYREDPDVPLVIPEVNPNALQIVRRQSGSGFIVTNPNCCAIPLTLALAPLHKTFGVEAVCASTWQAVSGAGYPGESAWDMIDNAHPHSKREESKLQSEPLKILDANFPISARCVRVPVTDGHLISAQVKLTGNPTPEQVFEAMNNWKPEIPDIPSSPKPLFYFHTSETRPSARFDRDAGKGMGISIGRIEYCPVMGVKFFCLAHNTIRGAAGAAIANVELLSALGYFDNL